MERAPFRVVLDANVLFPFTLRDTLLRAAAMGMFQVSWSDEILREVSRNLLATGRMNPAQVAHLLAAIRNAFPDASVHGYESLIPDLHNDAKDRHVAAVAVVAGAQVIVTLNLKDFQRLPDSIEALSPDVFLQDLLDLGPEEMLSLLEQQAQALQQPAVSLLQLLTGLGTVVPGFERQIRALLHRR